MLAYNIPGVEDLVLTREQVVGIYNGSINNWNDSVFAEHNPGVDLPNATIVPVARLDSSGSTEIFTKSLCQEMVAGKNVSKTTFFVCRVGR